MSTVNIHEAKTHFSKLLERVARGEEVVIARAGKPVAAIHPMRRQPRRFGAMRGKIVIHPDFDAPLPPDIATAFGMEPGR